MINSNAMEKKICRGTALYSRSVNQGAWQEHYLTVVPEENLSFQAVIETACSAVAQLGARAVSLEVFGPDEGPLTGLAVIDKTFGGTTFPVSWIQTHLDDHQELFGVNVWAVSGTELTPVTLNGRIVGNCFDTPYGRICRLGQLVASHPERSRADQTREVFDLAQAALAQVGMTYLNVCRTWFYNNDILAWYDTFNQVRTGFYQSQGVFDHLVPASTGIGGRNPHNSELLLGCLAIDSPNQQITVQALNSPLQCPAPAYGSSFSRAIEIDTPAVKRISVSGTASIAPSGESVHRDDIDAQIDLTMRVVKAILDTRSADWADVAQGIAYLRRADDADAFSRWRAANGLSDLPLVVTPNIVCRDDLLFEIEVEALLGKT